MSYVLTHMPTTAPSTSSSGRGVAPADVHLDGSDLLMIGEYAKAYRIAVSTVRKRLRLGTLTPWPFATRPYRWRRIDVVEDLGRKGAAPRVSKKKARARRRTQ